MKKALVVLLLAGFAFGAQADSIMYWMISGSSIAFETARIKTSDGNYLTLYDADLGSGNQGDEIEYAEADNTGKSTALARIGANVTDYGGSTFIIELWNDDRVVGKNAGYTYAMAVAANAIGTGDMFENGIGTLVISDFAAVPEPTSGMLFALGAMLLGLRRRPRPIA